MGVLPQSTLKDALRATSHHVCGHRVTVTLTYAKLTDTQMWRATHTVYHVVVSKTWSKTTLPESVCLRVKTPQRSVEARPLSSVRQMAVGTCCMTQGSQPGLLTSQRRGRGRRLCTHGRFMLPYARNTHGIGKAVILHLKRHRNLKSTWVSLQERWNCFMYQLWCWLHDCKFIELNAKMYEFLILSLNFTWKYLTDVTY